jgi:hypothetical protein
MITGCNAGKTGKFPVMENGGSRGNGNGSARILLLAARQPDLRGLLEEAGFTVDARRQPPKEGLPDADLALVFRGRLIGRNQAATLHDRGIPVVEVLTSEPTASSTARWLRLSNRISKPDLVQVVRAVADWATGNRASRAE